MMGADADPLKVALFRAASREYARCVARGGDAACVGGAGNGENGGNGGNGGNDDGVARLRTFERLMMTGGEHTWGWNGGSIRSKSWTNAQLQKSLEADDDFRTGVRTWIEQRALLRLGRSRHRNLGARSRRDEIVTRSR